MRGSGVCCDYTIISKNEKFLVHKIIMMSFSDFFHAMLTADMKDKHENTFVLNMIDPKVLGPILDFAYTGKIHIAEDNVLLLFQAASYLQIPSLLSTVERSVQTIVTVDNCINILHEAKMFCLDVACQYVHDFMVRVFDEVVTTERYIDLTAEELNQILGDEKLDITCELDLLEIVQNWMEQNERVNFDDDDMSIDLEDEKWRLFSDFMGHIRWSLISQDKINETLDGRLGMIIRKIPRCMAYIEEARLDACEIFQQPCSQRVQTRIRQGSNLYFASFNGENIKFRRYRRYGGNIVASSHSGLTMPSKYEYTIIEVNNFLFVWCCKNENTPLVQSRFVRYDPRFDVWLELARMTDDMHVNFAAVAYDNKIYAIGGGNDVRLSKQSYVYDIKDNRWNKLPKGPEFFRHAVCAVNSIIYVSGGFSKRLALPLEMMYSYDIKKRVWEGLMIMNDNRMDHTMTYIGDAIYVVGGKKWHHDDDNYDEPLETERYCRYTDEWFICRSDSEPWSYMDDKGMNLVEDDYGMKYRKEWDTFFRLHSNKSCALMYLPTARAETLDALD